LSILGTFESLICRQNVWQDSLCINEFQLVVVFPQIPLERSEADISFFRRDFSDNSQTDEATTARKTLHQRFSIDISNKPKSLCLDRKRFRFQKNALFWFSASDFWQFLAVLKKSASGLRPRFFEVFFLA